MSSAESFLSERIGRSGPVTFHEFMEAALYHPEFGYYRRARDPFGREGDFYTAEQLQPVFGILIAARIRSLFEEMCRPPDFRVVELGAGRGEMAEALSSFHYVSVVTGDPMPGRFTGVVFSNEFFDALPVHVAVRRGTSWNEMRISRRDRCFAWEECGEAPEEVRRYLDRYAGSPEEGNLARPTSMRSGGWRRSPPASTVDMSSRSTTDTPRGS
jgi:SAM-dependent MidA family methyltransferase